VYFVVTWADFLVIVCFYLLGCKNWGFCSKRVRHVEGFVYGVGASFLMFCCFVFCLYLFILVDDIFVPLSVFCIIERQKGLYRFLSLGAETGFYWLG
jgi:hypothetical protein